MIEQGGHFYISGSADKMPKDVKSALREVIVQEAKVSEEQAENYIKKMEQTKRYQVETWSHQYLAPFFSSSSFPFISIAVVFLFTFPHFTFRPLPQSSKIARIIAVVLELGRVSRN